MKIKQSNFLIITPIFFTIAFVVALLNYTNEKSEVMWGINEEAKSIAIASSIFIENIVTNSTLKNKKEEILVHLNRIKRYKQAKRFYITKNSKLIIDTKENKVKQKFKIIDKKEFKDRDVILSDIYKNRDISLMNVSSLIKINAKIIGILTVEIYATDVDKDLNEAIYEMLTTIFIITLIGVMVSILLSNIVTTKIMTLRSVANSIAKGNYNENMDIGTIKEFADLGDTLNTMKSIMQEILFKAKNSIIEEEQFRSNNDLLNSYSDIFLNSKVEIDDNFEVSIQKIGYLKVEYFFNIVSNEDSIFSFLGEIKSNKESIDNAIISSTINTYLSKKLLSSNNINFFDKFKEIFPIKELLITHINKKTKELKIYKFLNNTLHKKIIINRDKIFKFHTLDKELNSKIDTYLRNYYFLNLEDIADDLDKLFREKYNGIILLIKYK